MNRVTGETDVKNIYFDLCSIPIFLLVLGSMHMRRMNRGRANRTFIVLNALSLMCAVADLCSEGLSRYLPLSPGLVLTGTLFSYAYLALRNASLVISFMFLFYITRTDYQIRSRRNRLLVWLPYGVLVLALVQNIFTHNVFTVTPEAGYQRGPMIIVLYAVAALYGIANTAYTVYCRRYLERHKWLALLSVFALSFASVLIQLLKPRLLLEMFFSSIGILLMLMTIMRPEERVDASVGVLSWPSYREDLRNILISRQQVDIAVLLMANAEQVRAFLGDERYTTYVSQVADEIRRLCRRDGLMAELYFEWPGTIYMILEDAQDRLNDAVKTYLVEVRERTRGFEDMGARFDPRICLIRCPNDLSHLKDILNLGHKFPQLGASGQTVVRASDIVKSRNFDVVNNMEEILSQAVADRRLEMYYQPIYNVREQRYRSAEALVRLRDERYGMISPAIFIPAAEALGLILPIGSIVLDLVFRFISEHDLEALGLSYVEINLSVAQCMQPDLPDELRRLQKKYSIRPEQVNLEITETTFNSISDTVERNLLELTKMGYSFSLDDYGIGYSNIQRLSRLPLSIIKIDKSMVDGMFTHNGWVIMQNTVRMMQGIDKALVVEGVETREESEALAGMACEYIQGFYYSRPLPEDAFIRFLAEHNAPDAQERRRTAG